MNNKITKYRIISEENYNDIKSLADSGKSQKYIAIKYKCSQTTISRFATKHKIDFQHRKSINTKFCNETFFDHIDTEEKAYILGFLIADGCIREEKRKSHTSYRICFSNSIDDIDVLTKIHKILCPENKMLHVHNKNGAKNRKEQILIQFTATYMAKTLKEKYGICANKTKNTSFLFPIELMPRELCRHFVRGYFDGDGSFTSKKDVRFVFNSPYFMRQIIDILEQEFYDADFSYSTQTINGKTVNYWRVIINIGNKRLKKLYSVLYDESNICLSRKKRKIEYELQKIQDHR